MAASSGVKRRWISGSVPGGARRRNLSDGELVYAGQKTFPHRIIARPLAHFGRVAVIRSPHVSELNSKAPAKHPYGGPVRETILVSEFHP